MVAGRLHLRRPVSIEDIAIVRGLGMTHIYHSHVPGTCATLPCMVSVCRMYLDQRRMNRSSSALDEYLVSIQTPPREDSRAERSDCQFESSRGRHDGRAGESSQHKAGLGLEDGDGTV